LTETGDYRFLEGVSNGNQLNLSTFDGSHAFLFEGTLLNDTIKGGFWSGNHYYASWIATRQKFNLLKHADSLTYLKQGYEKLDFGFYDENDLKVGLADFYGKPTIVQLLGTWCPNCMDETFFLTNWQIQNPSSNIQIIGLAYEYGNNRDYAHERIAKLKKKLKVEYPILYAGSYKKEEASKTLPMLNKIISFPTLIFLNSAHEIIRIHTGFSGPATGNYYEKFVDSFDETISSLK